MSMMLTTQQCCENTCATPDPALNVRCPPAFFTVHHHLPNLLVSRRGPRPAGVPQVGIARSFAPKAVSQESGVVGLATTWQAGPTDAFRTTPHIRSNVNAVDQAAAGISQQPVNSTQHSQSAQPHGPGVMSAPSELFSSNELQQLSSLLSAPSSLSAAPQELGQHEAQAMHASNLASMQPSSAAVMSGQDPAGVLEHDQQRLSGKLGPFGAGMIDRLMAMEDAGEWQSQGCQQWLR